MKITNPDASADRLIVHLPVFARREYTDMIAAIDARARSQTAAAFAARLSWIASNLADLAATAADADQRRRIADLAAMATESANNAAALARSADANDEEPQRQPAREVAPV